MMSKKQSAMQQGAKRIMQSSLNMSGAVFLLMGLANPAAAHVNYVDLSDPLVSPGGINGSSFTSFGWNEGTTAALGDSHSLAGGDFFKFHLDQAANVSITFDDVSGSGGLNPAFSLYSGLFAAEAHDDTTVDPLNPSHLELTPTPHTVYDKSLVDNGVNADAGRISPFRDTANQRFNGQFDALNSWSMANESGEWHVVDYITHVGPTGGNSVSLENYFLQAGDYTIAAGGGYARAVSAVEGLSGTISLNVAAVPVPASIWLFGSAIAGLGALRKKRLA
jgi:hypothetical protein